MEPREKTASPHQWRRTTTSGPEEDHSRTRRSNGWAECREKNIGIEPMENTFLLTFLLIGHCDMSCGLQNYNSPGTRDFAPLRGILPLLILEPVHIFTLAVPSFTPVTLFY